MKIMDTSLMEKGIGIAFVGVGAGIALGAMKNFIDSSPRRVGKPPVSFKTPKLFEPIKIKKRWR